MAEKVVIQVDSEVGGAISGLSSVTGKLSAMSAAAKSVGGRMMDVGKAGMLTTTAPIVGALGVATKGALDFDTQIGDMSRALDLNGSQLEKMRSQILNAAPALGQMPTQFAEIATEAGKLGVSADKIMGFSSLVSKGVMATGADSIDLAKNLAALQTITGASAGDLEKLVAAANKVDDAIGGSTPEILEFVRQTAASGKLLNINTKELAAYGGAMQSLGIQNGVAYRTMNKVMTTLAAPQVLTSAQAEGMKALGISAQEMSAKMKKSGTEGIQFFYERVKAIAKVDPQKALGAVKQLIGADFGDEVLTSALAVDKLSQALKYSTDDAGNLAKFQGEVDKKLKGSAGQITILKANLAKIGIVIGSALLPVINKLLTTITPALEKFGRFAEANPKIVQVAVVIAGVVAAVAPLLVVLGSIITAIGTIGTAIAGAMPFFTAIGGAIAAVVAAISSTPVLIGLAIAGIAAAVYALWKNWSWIEQRTGISWNNVVGIIAGAATAIVAALVGVPVAIAAPIGAVIAAGVTLWKNWSWIEQRTGIAWRHVAGIIVGACAAIVAAIVGVPALIAAAIGAVIGAGIAIWQNWDWLSKQAGVIWGKTTRTLSEAVGAIPGILKQAFVMGIAGLAGQMGGIIAYSTQVASHLGKVFEAAGQGMMGGLAKGIYDAARQPFQVIQDVMSKIREYLPGSDAKRGALSDLTASGRALPQTLATGISSNLSALTTAANTVASYALPQLKARLSPAMPASGGGDHSTTTLNFAPVIHLSGSATEDDGRRLVAQIDRWATEVLEVLDRNRTRNNRR